ncbi:MAG TPA: PAS domain-containing protein [Burkholderiales bacterium]|nr:PAS domain-containing protein [Burkholderiales bacterium]
MMPAPAIRRSHRFEEPLPEKSSVVPIAFSAIESERVRTVYTAWTHWRGARAMPTRNEIIMRDLGNAAANISLVHALPQENDYEFRVIGAAHVQAYNLNLQGKRISDALAVSSRFGKILKSSYDMVCAMRRPYAFRGIVGQDAPRTRFVRFETCYLPFGPSPDKVDYVMNAAFYTPRGGSWD